MGLTENDKESEDILTQAFDTITNDKALKSLFVNLMINGMATNPWELFQKFKNQLCSDQMRKAEVTGEPTAEMVNILLLELKDLFEELDEDMAFYFGKANMPTDVPKEKSVPQEYQCEVEYDLAVEIEKAETNKGNLFKMHQYWNFQSFSRLV